MPGLVRCLLVEKDEAAAQLPLLVELGDTELLYDLGQLDGEHAQHLAKHLLMVYHKNECPLSWEELGLSLLRASGPSNTFQILLRLSCIINPGDISQRFYSDLMVAALQEEFTPVIHLPC